MSDSPYILVTAARNEAAYITQTLRSVTAQTQPPQRWIIVSDGSTDETDEIVRGFVNQYPYIELLRVEADGERNFGSKALAVNAGYKKISDIKHAYVGILDADVSFGPDYCEQVISRFENDPRLGIAGGALIDVVDGRQIPQINATEWSVGGAVQMFRRECWCAIGGYLPIRGGIDAAAEFMARMHGWTVRAFPELRVVHHRQTGREKHSLAGFFFHTGLEDHHLGYHPLFFLAKSVRRFRSRPVMIGGLLMLCGYVWATLSRKPKKVPDDVIRYLRREQMGRLRARLGLQKEERA
jgi:glycosyltransferase involved in cell wall biosynthesis